jgi:hypothetical protein
MARKTSFSINIDISVLVSIMVGIIVLLIVYIIVNNKKQVTFAVPEVTQEIIVPSYYREEPVFLQQPTYFNPNSSFLGHSHDHQGNTTNMYNIQTKEAFTGSDFSSFISSVLPTRSSPPTMPATMPSNMPSNMPNMNNSSQSVQMNIPMPMEDGSDSAASI